MKKTKIQLAFERAEKRTQERKKKEREFFKDFKERYGVTYSQAKKKYK